MLQRIRAAANAAVANLERRVLDWLLPHIVVVVDQEITKAIEGLRDELEAYIETVIQEKADNAWSCLTDKISEDVNEKMDEAMEDFDHETVIKDIIQDSSDVADLIKEEVRDALDGEELTETLHEWLVTHPQTANKMAEALRMHLPGLAQAVA